MDVFKRGVFCTVREDYDCHCHQKLKRAYFAGAIDFRELLRPAPICSQARCGPTCGSAPFTGATCAAVVFFASCF